MGEIWLAVVRPHEVKGWKCPQPSARGLSIRVDAAADIAIVCTLIGRPGCNRHLVSCRLYLVSLFLRSSLVRAAPLLSTWESRSHGCVHLPAKAMSSKEGRRSHLERLSSERLFPFVKIIRLSAQINCSPRSRWREKNPQPPEVPPTARRLRFPFFLISY